MNYEIAFWIGVGCLASGVALLKGLVIVLKRDSKDVKNIKTEAELNEHYNG